MARLNEQPTAPDSLELLRRRFLRQNRDIAKINSVQSLKIRGLENECARLLSENLELRGQILRLEQEAQDSSAQRIADHALEIKSKMEATLEEWSSMISGLGVEPPSKRRSLERRKQSKSRSSTSRSPPQRRLRDLSINPEALAAQEGRLPPIYEHKSYPRATMNSEQILALCFEAADSGGNSPDLGPPPVSRYVEEDPVKIDSPTPKTMKEGSETMIEEYSQGLEEKMTTPPKLDFGKKLLTKSNLSPEDGTYFKPSNKGLELEEELDRVSQPAPMPISTPIAPTKVGAKRKYRDENESAKPIKPLAGKENSVSTDSEKALQGRHIQNRRAIKEIPASKREKVADQKTNPLATRTPLSTKSTNDDVSSPKKLSKAPVTDEIKPVKQQVPKKPVLKEKSRPQEKLSRIEIPEPEPVPKVTTIPEPETSFSPAIVSPDTPVCPAQKPVAHDTPPPPGINANGEGPRPNRRARQSVSYAEPNLRDKMRRPTKELFDAVSGEGKFIQRAKSDVSSGVAPTSVTKIKAEPESAESSSTWKDHPADDHTSRRQSAMSPLAQKQLSPDMLQDTVVSDRRRRPSSVSHPTLQTNEPAAADDEEQHPHSTPKASADPDTDPAPVDIYDFATLSSPPNPEETTGTKSKPRISRRSSAAVSSSSSSSSKSVVAVAAAEDPAPETTLITAASSKSRSSHPRKRASMLAPKKASVAELLNLNDGGADPGGGDESSGDVSMEGGDGAETKGRISERDKVTRRRSMML